MEVLPIKTPVLTEGDDLAGLLAKEVREGDIIVVSSKAVATVEGAAMNLSEYTPSPQAIELSQGHGPLKSPAFYEAVLQETARMNGSVIHANYGVALTELHPDGMEGCFLVPNAGLDMSNIAEGCVIGWPRNPVASVKTLQKELGEIGIILSDSGLSPRRRGVTAFAICCAGIDPIVSMIDAPDLFGNNLHVTEEAVADQLATAGNAIMGNADQCIPAAIIRNHGYTRSDFCGFVPGIERGKDLYHGVI